MYRLYASKIFIFILKRVTLFAGPQGKGPNHRISKMRELLLIQSQAVNRDSENYKKMILMNKNVGYCYC